MGTTEEILHDKRRLFERFPSRFPTKFKDSRSDFGTTVHLRNCSAQGAKITTSEQLFVHDNVSIEVELPDGKHPLTLRGEVLWAHRLEEDLWEVGIKFHKILFMDMWRICKALEASNLF